MFGLIPIVHAGNSPNFAPPARLEDLEVVYSNVISVALGLAGVALFIMLVIAGFNYMTAGGDPGKAEAARKTATTAILGLFLVASSYFILYVLSKFFGANQLLNFDVFK